MAVSLQDESGYQQDSCEFIGRVGTGRIEEEARYLQDSCGVFRKNLRTSRIAVKSLRRVWTLA